MSKALWPQCPTAPAQRHYDPSILLLWPTNFCQDPRRSSAGCHFPSKPLLWSSRANPPFRSPTWSRGIAVLLGSEEQPSSSLDQKSATTEIEVFFQQRIATKLHNKSETLKGRPGAISHGSYPNCYSFIVIDGRIHRATHIFEQHIQSNTGCLEGNEGIFQGIFLACLRNLPTFLEKASNKKRGFTLRLQDNTNYGSLQHCMIWRKACVSAEGPTTGKEPPEEACC